METGEQRQRQRTSDTVFAATACLRPAFEADTERAAPPGPNFIERRVDEMTRVVRPKVCKGRFKREAAEAPEW